MYLAIRHTTAYSYEHSVSLEPHIIRLTPRADSYKHLLERTLTIIPEPDGSSVHLDSNGSMTQLVWFKRKTSVLTVISRVIVELNESNPFAFIVYPASCLNLPMQYPSNIVAELKPFLGGQVNEQVKTFALGIMQESKNNVLDFATLLCQKIKRNCTYETRDLGQPYEPQKVLADRRGSCRDLAWLYVAAARAVGLAARFVSGYYFDQSPKHPQLHAWAEVYIPGGGWRSYDPTIGLACYGHHIALAAGAFPSQTAAIEGSFLGNPDAHMEVNIEYEYLKEPSFPVEF